jgi:hypothetical protein
LKSRLDAASPVSPLPFEATVVFDFPPLFPLEGLITIGLVEP